MVKLRVGVLWRAFFFGVAVYVSSVAAGEPQPMSEDVAILWANSCALCHVRGEGGAPRAGDQAAWAPRTAKGMPTLVQHTVEGFNNMPPLGYCMACEQADLEVMIRFMMGIAGMPE